MLASVLQPYRRWRRVGVRNRRLLGWENPRLRKYHDRFRIEPFPVFDTESGHA